MYPGASSQIVIYSFIALTDLCVSRIASRIREKLLCLFTIKAATLQYLGRVVWSVEQALALINTCDHTIQTLMLQVLCILHIDEYSLRQD